MWLWRMVRADGEAKKILANAGWLYADQAVRAGAVLAAFSLVARSLGPEQFGVLSYAIAFPGIFLPLAMLGLDYVLVQDFVRHPAERDRILGTAIGLKALAAIAAVVFALVAAGVAPIDAGARPLIVVTTLSLLFQPLLSLDFYFQSQVAAKFPAMARMASCLAANGLRVALALRGAPVSWFAAVFAVEAALYGASLTAVWRIAGGPWLHLRRTWDGGIARRLLRAAWPLLLADGAIALYLKFDQVLLRHLAGAEELGRYAAAYRLADAAEFFALAIINSYFPKIVRLQAAGGAEFAAEVRRFFRRMTGVAIGIAVAVSVAAPWIGAVVLGPKFGGVWPVLVVLTWANVFVTQVAVRGKWFLVEGWQVYSLAFFGVGAAVHLGLLTWVAPRWGAVGAAASLAVAQAAMVLVAPWFFARSRPAAVLALRSWWPGRS